MSASTEATIRLRVGPVVREDWQSREIAATITWENGDEYAARYGTTTKQANPFAHFVESSTAELTLAELEHVIRDCDYYAEPDGPAGSDASLRAAYRRLLSNARAKRTELTERALAELEGADDEYEHIGDTPTTGGPLVFVACLAAECDYLAGGEPAPASFRVHVEHGPHGTFRLLTPA